MTRTSLALLSAFTLLALPASAQLGTTANPPSQRLFDFNQPKRLDTGLGANASSRPTAEPARPRKRTVRHPK